MEQLQSKRQKGAGPVSSLDKAPRGSKPAPLQAQGSGFPAKQPAKLTHNYNIVEMNRDLKIQRRSGGMQKIFKRIVGDLKDRVQLMNLDEESAAEQYAKLIGEDPGQTALVIDKNWVPLARIPELVKAKQKEREVPSAKKTNDLLTLQSNCQAMHEYDSSDEERAKPSSKKTKTRISKKQEVMLANLVASMQEAAQKERRNQLTEFFRDVMRRDAIPGENSVDKQGFAQALGRVSIIRQEGRPIKQNIASSQRQIQHIKTGKGLLETFRLNEKTRTTAKEKTECRPSLHTSQTHQTTNSSSSEFDRAILVQSSNGPQTANRRQGGRATTQTEGLPIFSDRDYTSNLQRLLTCKELEYSFPISEHSPMFGKFVEAQNFGSHLAKKLEERKTVGSRLNRGIMSSLEGPAQSERAVTNQQDFAKTFNELSECQSSRAEFISANKNVEHLSK